MGLFAYTQPRILQVGAHSEPGFRFDLAGLNKDGLEINGLACGAIIDKKLYLVLYSGARANYFPKYRKEAEHIMGSIEVL